MNISFGAQIGAEGKIAGNNIGGHINIINAELLSFKEELFGQGDKGTGASWNYLNKDGLVKVTQSVELAAEVINIGAEKRSEERRVGKECRP